MSRSFDYYGTQFEIPNAKHFAFDPAIIRVTNSPKSIASYAVEVWSLSRRKLYVEEREVYDQQCVFDIRRYLQMEFSDARFSELGDGLFVASPLEKSVDIEFALSNINGASGPIGDVYGIDVIWGAMSARESSGGVMRRKWFVAFPFTIDVYAKEDTTFDVQIDGKQSDVVIKTNEKDAKRDSPYHRYLMNPAKAIDPSTAARSVYIAAPKSLVLKNDEESVGLVAYMLDIDRSTSGIYLRWIDRQGRYCYYLFKEIGQAATIAATSTWERNDMAVPTSYVKGVNIETSARQHLTQKTTRTLGAKSVDTETFDFLLTLARSVVVDVFDGYDTDNRPLWHRVNIVPGSYEKTAKRYQEFIFSIEEPAQSAQML